MFGQRPPFEGAPVSFGFHFSGTARQGFVNPFLMHSRVGWHNLGRL
jgi:hypothetical protein